MSFKLSPNFENPSLLAPRASAEVADYEFEPSRTKFRTLQGKPKQKRTATRKPLPKPEDTQPFRLDDTAYRQRVADSLSLLGERDASELLNLLEEAEEEGLISPEELRQLRAIPDERELKRPPPLPTFEETAHRAPGSAKTVPGNRTRLSTRVWQNKPQVKPKRRYATHVPEVHSREEPREWARPRTKEHLAPAVPTGASEWNHTPMEDTFQELIYQDVYDQAGSQGQRRVGKTLKKPHVPYYSVASVAPRAVPRPQIHSSSREELRDLVREEFSNILPRTQHQEMHSSQLGDVELRELIKKVVHDEIRNAQIPFATQHQSEVQLPPTQKAYGSVPYGMGRAQVSAQAFSDPVFLPQGHQPATYQPHFQGPFMHQQPQYGDSTLSSRDQSRQFVPPSVEMGTDRITQPEVQLAARQKAQRSQIQGNVQLPMFDQPSAQPQWNAGQAAQRHSMASGHIDLSALPHQVEPRLAPSKPVYTPMAPETAVNYTTPLAQPAPEVKERHQLFSTPVGVPDVQTETAGYQPDPTLKPTHNPIVGSTPLPQLSYESQIKAKVQVKDSRTTESDARFQTEIDSFTFPVLPAPKLKDSKTVLTEPLRATQHNEVKQLQVSQVSSKHKELLANPAPQAHSQTISTALSQEVHLGETKKPVVEAVPVFDSNDEFFTENWEAKIAKEPTTPLSTQVKPLLAETEVEAIAEREDAGDPTPYVPISQPLQMRSSHTPKISKHEKDNPDILQMGQATDDEASDVEGWEPVD